MYSDLLFYLFSSLMLLSAIMVLFAINPVHSVFFLILVFCFASGLLLLLNVEFLGIVLIIVYVGAIAVLFLFVVMMLNIRLIEITENIISYLPIGIIVGLIFLSEIIYIFSKDLIVKEDISLNWFDSWIDQLDGVSNFESLGSVLYTYYVYFFIVAGLILLVAMVGSIVLTLHHKLNVKRQEVYQQVGRDYKLAMIKKNITI